MKGRRLGWHPIISTFENLLKRVSSFGFRGEFNHQLPTAVGKAILVEGIEGLLAFFARLNQPCLAQNGKVMRNGRLGDVELFCQFAHRDLAATARAHDLLAGVVGDGFGKEDGIIFHIDNFRCDYIDICLFVKRALHCTEGVNHRGSCVEKIEQGGTSLLTCACGLPHQVGFNRLA